MSSELTCVLPSILDLDVIPWLFGVRRCFAKYIFSGDEEM